jgi:type IV secretory pathway TraG/TraD family ATPase VirD4
MFGQPNVSLDLDAALEEGHIILVNLSREKGRFGREDAELFATLMLNDLWAAARARGKNKGKPFYIYLDEFQRFVTPTIAESLDEARGFGLHMCMAHQYPTQLLNQGAYGKALYDSMIVNARSKVVFSLNGDDDLKAMALAVGNESVSNALKHPNKRMT